LALKLRRVGITRIRPLSGGYAEWKDRGYPLQDTTDGLEWRSDSNISLSVAGSSHGEGADSADPPGTDASREKALKLTPPG
jgi:hypothetical protein